MLKYMENGVMLGWLIDPQNQQVYVYHAREPVEILEEAAGVSADSV